MPLDDVWGIAMYLLGCVAFGVIIGRIIGFFVVNRNNN